MLDIARITMILYMILQLFVMWLELMLFSFSLPAFLPIYAQ